MSRRMLCLSSCVFLLGLGIFYTLAVEPRAADAPSQPVGKPGELRQQATKTMGEGNFAEAYEMFRRLALSTKENGQYVQHDLSHATQCLQRLNRVDEVDALYEAVADAHQSQWLGLWGVAQNYMNVDHRGFIVAGEFSRGQKRGNQGGKPLSSEERDRVRALQLMMQAWPMAREDDRRTEVSGFLNSLANMLLNNRGHGEAWRLQYLTDLETLPDYQDGWWHGHQHSWAPVDAEGNPVFYDPPRTFDEAKNDGERWRWALEQSVEFNPAVRDNVLWQRANFLWQQFGVQTMAQFGWRFGRASIDDSNEDETGTYALPTLGHDETIARLAIGVKRFTLPDDHNFIKLLQRQIEISGTYAESARQKLAQLFENRRQYPQAANFWRQLVEQEQNTNQRKHYQQRLDQIVDNWGRFEPIGTQPARSGASVEYRFRNGSLIELSAHRIKVDKLLGDVKDYLKSNPNQVDHQKTQIGNIGYRLVHENQKRYIGERVAQWKMIVNPRRNHFDKRVTISTPLQEPGAYLLKAKMHEGNTSYVILWVADTAIVRKPLENASFYYLADAVTGEPIADARMELFGWRIQHRGNRPRPRQYDVLTKEAVRRTDKDGQLIVGIDRDGNGASQRAQLQQKTPAQKTPANNAPARQMLSISPRYQWLVTARTDDGRFAYLGFDHVWYGQRHDAEYHATKTFAMTDRPVYRPDQKVNYQFWVRHAQYDKEDVSQFAGQTFQVEIRNPKNEKIVEKSFTADQYGGLGGELKLEEEATLGRYQMIVRQGNRHLGSGSFRVEEYKKPEFEVTVDAPTEPVALGEKFSAKVTAKYYFGAPVTKAKVKYTVKRTAKDEAWFPVMPWDWLYGSGYWWFAPRYAWLPGWDDWGYRLPPHRWMPHWRGHQPPELVAEGETEVGEDGTIEVPIDTELAKVLHPDQDHRYEITAEVTDQSRRTIVGSGEVLVSRKPFEVHLWVERGYFRVGDTVRAHVQGRRIDGQPVTGTGKLTLYRITYDHPQADDSSSEKRWASPAAKLPPPKPIETKVQEWQLDTDNEGRAVQQLTASRGGQFRLSYELTDAAGHSIEGGYAFTVMGEGFQSSQYRFNAVELLPEKTSYQPKEKVQMQVNTDRAGGTVLLFVRPTNGVYLEPRVLRLQGKSTVEAIEVAKRDMPNFFVEALTVADGGVHTHVKQITVPPEKRVLNVEIEPSKERYKPGEKAKVKLKLTDFHGEPFVGSTVVTIYDKSVEYISGGSNVPEIKEFFWKWQRHHNPRTDSSLARFEGNLVPPNTRGMSNLGVFGASVPEEPGGEDESGMDVAFGGVGGGGFGMARNGGRPGSMMMQRRSAVMADGMAMPAMEAAAPAGNEGMAFTGARAKGAGPAGGEAGEQLVQPTVRTQFADTALWAAALETSADGTTEIELDMPENLTTWRIKVWAMGHGTNVGQGQTDVVTSKNLIVRLQAPRFFVQTDEVVLSANVHNYLDAKKKVQVKLELEGDTLQAFEKIPGPTIRGRGGEPVPGDMEPRDLTVQPISPTIEIEPNGEARVDWRVKAVKEGEAVIRMSALTDEESDAMEQRFPVYVHGMEKMEARSGVIRPDEDKASISFDVPAERRPEESQLVVRYSPTLAGAMVDALPYLAEYPYGCTEQTLNRFVPTVIVQKILIDMGLDLEKIRDKRANLNAQELGDPAERAAQWKGPGFENPVFDEAEVRRMVRDGVKRLGEMQLSDGGWGWFSGYGEHSSPHTTATVVHGLQVAKQNDVAVPKAILERGVNWLKRYQEEQVVLLNNALIKDKPKGLRWKNRADNIDALVYMVLVDAGVKNKDMTEFLYRDRTELSVYAMAVYGVALETQGDQEPKLQMIMRNISQYVEQDDENQTAWLNLGGSPWWYWYGSEFEAQAYYLKLLARTDPKGELASRMVKYLLNNRKHATYWNSTRDTALCIEAMAEYMQASGEAKPEMTVKVFLGDELKKSVEITPEVLFQFDDRFTLAGEQVPSGKLDVRLERDGDGPLYFNAYQTNFTLEDFITAAGLEIKVNRRYFRLKRVEATEKVVGSRGQAVDQRVEKFERQPLENLAELKSGELVEVELVIESKNDYEYLVFEDFKPAGFEPVELRSGYGGNTLGAYVEYRDERVVFFVRKLARGKHSTSYRMRAEIPGRFSALPTKAWAMYAPELKGNSDEIKLRVED